MHTNPIETSLLPETHNQFLSSSFVPNLVSLSQAWLECARVSLSSHLLELLTSGGLSNPKAVST